MKKIDSFKIDHTKFGRGIYISRIDNVQDTEIVTFDVRVKIPNKEEAMSSAVMHTIEHLGATFLRNSKIKENVIYFGGMGCLTGFYMILKNENIDVKQPLFVRDLVRDLFMFVSSFKGEIPGATEVECGNYKLHDLDGAINLARQFLKEVILRSPDPTLLYTDKQHL